MNIMKEPAKNLKRINVINTFSTSVGTVFEVQLIANLNVEDLVFYNKSYYQIDRVSMPKIPGNKTKISLVVHEVNLNESEVA